MSHTSPCQKASMLQSVKIKNTYYKNILNLTPYFRGRGVGGGCIICLPWRRKSQELSKEGESIV